MPEKYYSGKWTRNVTFDIFLSETLILNPTWDTLSVNLPLKMWTKLHWCHLVSENVTRERGEESYPSRPTVAHALHIYRRC